VNITTANENPRAALRGADVRKVFAGERRKLVSVCGWCPDVEEQTAAARAHGFDVTHGICAACAIRWRNPDGM